MYRESRTVRVFVSGTLHNLKAEPDTFQIDVFLRLPDYCRKQGCRFQVIHLRRGVYEEAPADESTMRICPAKIARC